MRLDLFLSGKPDIRSRAEGKRMIDAGLVKVNGKVMKKASRDVTSADKVVYDHPEAPPVPKASKTNIQLPILYEDDACFVISKPKGMIVHPGSGMKVGAVTLLDALRPIFAKKRLPFSVSSVLVHRLDKDTTGCLLIAKNPVAHTALQKQFAGRTTKKTYLALVFGKPSPASAVINIPLGRDASTRTKMSVHRTVSSREAKTTYATLGSTDKVSLLACDLHTGRTHQIRVHLAAIKHPILGDETYGTQDSAERSKKLKIDSVALHAWKLAFRSPATKKNVTVQAPLPSTFASHLKRLGLEI